VRTLGGSQVAREWRLKWSDPACLEAVQALAAGSFDALKATNGFKSLHRVVCGECHDYKLVIALDADAFGAFASAGFGPEPDFLAKVAQIPGVSTVETQTYTFMAM